MLVPETAVPLEGRHSADAPEGRAPSVPSGTLRTPVKRRLSALGARPSGASAECLPSRGPAITKSDKRSGASAVLRHSILGLCLAGALNGIAQQATESAPPPGVEEQAIHSEIEAILANPLGNADYINESRCIAGAGYGSVEIVDDRNLIFEGRRGKLWWNRLRQRCLGLHPAMRLTMERRSWRFCARDRFRGVGRSSTELPSTICELGNFVELDAESSELLRRAIEASRRNTVVGTTVRRAAK